MRRVHLLTLLVFVLLVSKTWACVEQGAHFSAEVLIAKEDVSWELDQLGTQTSTQKTTIHWGDVKAVAYPSHYDQRVIVIIAEEEYQGKKLFDMMLQIPYERRKWNFHFLKPYVEAVDIRAERFDFNRAFKTELEWLSKMGVLQGLTNSDIKTISSKVGLGKSGYNHRMIYTLDAMKAKEIRMSTVKRSPLDNKTSCGRDINQELLIRLIKGQ